MMRPDIKKAIKKINTEGWKRVPMEFGRHVLNLSLPSNCVELSMKDVPIVPDPKGAIEKAFSNPIESPRLEEIIHKKGKPPEEMSVAIAVSDITRPVPYKGEKGILNPMLSRLESNGIKKENIKIIVATGMHRPSTVEEKVEMYGEEVFKQYTILDHDCENNDLLEGIGKTKEGRTSMSIEISFFLISRLPQALWKATS